MFSCLHDHANVCGCLRDHVSVRRYLHYHVNICGCLHDHANGCSCLYDHVSVCSCLHDHTNGYISVCLINSVFARTSQCKCLPRTLGRQMSLRLHCLHFGDKLLASVSMRTPLLHHNTLPHHRPHPHTS